jgi:tol-pal system protein YbgF
LGCGLQKAAQSPPPVDSSGYETSKEDPQNQIASLNRQYEEVQNRVASNRQRIETLEKELASLRQSVETIGHAHQSPKSTGAKNRLLTDESDTGAYPLGLRTASPDAIRLYRSAFEAYFFQENYPVAISRFREFLSTFPPNELTDNALYWMGESYYAHKDFEMAIPSFLKLIENYPYAGTVPEALLKIGLSYAHLKSPKKAREFLVRVMDEYPFSEAAKEAKARLNQRE